MTTRTIKVTPVGALIKLDGQVRASIPKKFRQDLKLQPGDYLEAFASGDDTMILRVRR